MSEFYNFPKTVVDELRKRYADSVRAHAKWCKARSNRDAAYVKRTVEGALSEFDSFALKRFAEVKDALLEGRLLIVQRGGSKYETFLIIDNKVESIPMTIKKSLSGHRLNWETSEHHVYGANFSKVGELIGDYAHALGILPVAGEMLPLQQKV